MRYVKVICFVAGSYFLILVVWTFFAFIISLTPLKELAHDDMSRAVMNLVHKVEQLVLPDDPGFWLGWPLMCWLALIPSALAAGIVIGYITGRNGIWYAITGPFLVGATYAWQGFTPGAVADMGAVAMTLRQIYGGWFALSSLGWGVPLSALGWVIGQRLRNRMKGSCIAAKQG